MPYLKVSSDNNEACSGEMRLSILIVNYQTPELTIQSIESVFREHPSTDFEIIVLDNGSKDASIELISKAPFIDRCLFIVEQENVGFAAGNNIAAKKASGDYLLLLNPDTVVIDKAIEKLLCFAKEYPEAGIWGGRTLFADGSLNPFSCWGRQTIWGLVSQALGLNSLFRSSSFFSPESIGGWDREGVRRVDIVSGCFFLIRRELWNKLNGFDQDFFMYGEEADLCLRAQKHGATPMVTSAATIIHYGGASEKIVSEKMIKLLRAKMLLIDKHFDETTRVFGKVLLACWPFSRYIAHQLLYRLGRKASAEPAKTWGIVWKNRNTWFIKG